MTTTATTIAATSTATTATTTSIKSVLDKPLHDLTEDDISQLTREDCRRYLKDKGMRRPSWNKSQAIQQVISLKSLLEPAPPRPALPPPVPPPPPPIEPRLPSAATTVLSNSSSSVKELSPAGGGEGSWSALPEDGGPNQPAGPSSSDAAREGECRAAIDGEAMRVRSTDVPSLPIGQMTIFYSGKVNVYDGVPVDKQARAIMHVAASPLQFCQDEPSSGNTSRWSTPCQLPATNVIFNVVAPDAATVQSVITGKMAEPVQHCRLEGNILHEQDGEGQTNRQVSLQRYFEKRKDRGKFKMKRKIGSSSSGLQMYLNNQLRTPVGNGQKTQSTSNSPSQLGLPHTGYGVMDKQCKNPGLSVDLNDKA